MKSAVITCCCSVSCALPLSVSVRTIVREMYDCPLLHGGNQDVQVRGREGGMKGFHFWSLSYPP